MSASWARGRNAALAKKQADQVVLRRMARQRDRSEEAAIAAGPHWLEIRALRAWLRAMTIRDGRLLVERIASSSIREADDAARRYVLGLVLDAIARVRAREGLPPADDPLPGQPPNAFMAIRDLLRDRTAPEAPHG